MKEVPSVTTGEDYGYSSPSACVVLMKSSVSLVQTLPSG